MIAYGGRHTIHQAGGQLYWRNELGGMEGINNGFALFSSQQLQAEHQQTRFSIRFGLQGKQVYQIKDEVLKVTPHQFLVMNSGTEYGVMAEDMQDTTMLAFCFNEQFVSDFVTSVSLNEMHLLDNFQHYQSEAKILEFPLHTQLVNEEIRRAVSQIVQAKINLSQEEVDDYEVFNQVLELIVRHHHSSLKAFDGQRIVKTSTRLELYKRLSMARDYIHAHYKEDLNLAELSRVACLSPYHFHRAFKRTFHTTPKKLVTQLRIERARWLLQNRRYSVQRICHEVGFRDVSSFTRLFTRYEGVTPSVYRSTVSMSLRSTA